MNTSQSRHISFSSATKVSFIPSLSEVTAEERQAIWLTEEETFKIQRDILKTVKRMRRGADIDEKKYCSRGLEHMKTPSHAAQRKNIKKATYSAVLSEQKEQRVLGICDPLRICQVSSACSMKSREEALHLGESDAIAAGSNERIRNTENEHKACLSILEDALNITELTEVGKRKVDTKCISFLRDQMRSRESTKKEVMDEATAGRESFPPANTLSRIAGCFFSNLQPEVNEKMLSMAAKNSLSVVK